MYETRLSGME